MNYWQLRKTATEAVATQGLAATAAYLKDCAPSSSTDCWVHMALALADAVAALCAGNYPVPSELRRPSVGARVVLTEDVERYPDFIARAGSTGTVVESEPDSVSVRLDERLLGAEEWGNCVIWDKREVALASQGLTAPFVLGSLPLAAHSEVS